MKVLSTEEVNVLRAEYVVPQGKGEKTLCPSCGGHNFWITEDENALGHCFNCSASYRIGEARDYSAPVEPFKDISLLRSFYTEIASFYYASLRKEHRTYLHTRGITDYAIERFMIGFCPEDVHSLYLHPVATHAGIVYKDRQGTMCPFLAGRITFPYVVDGVVTDIRGRACNPDEEIRYKSLYKSTLYRSAFYPFNWEAYNKNSSWILTEGEIKAIVAAEEGFACVALPGMTNWRRKILPRLEDDVVICFDRTANAQRARETDRAIKRIVDRLPMARIASLPLLGEEKQDIDSFLLHASGGKERFKEVLACALPYSRYKELKRI